MRDARLIRLEVRNIRVANRWNPFKKPGVEFELTRIYEGNERRAMVPLDVLVGDTLDLHIEHTKRPVIR